MNRSDFRKLVRNFTDWSDDAAGLVDQFNIDPYLVTEDGIDDVNARPAAAEAARDLLRSLGADEEIIRKAETAYAVELVFALVNEFADIHDGQDRRNLFRLLYGDLAGLGDKLRQSQRADGGSILERVARKMLDPKIVDGFAALRAAHGEHGWRGRKTIPRAPVARDPDRGPDIVIEKDFEESWKITGATRAAREWMDKRLADVLGCSSLVHAGGLPSGSSVRVTGDTWSPLVVSFDGARDVPVIEDVRTVTEAATRDGLVVHVEPEDFVEKEIEETSTEGEDR